MNREKLPRHPPPLILVFDIETEPFTTEFRRAKIVADRLKCCPKIRLAGVYNSRSRKYSFYNPALCRDLIRALLKADKVVTFNGIQFDLLVLQRHGGLSERNLQRIQKKHVDLYRLISRETGRSYSLGELALENLGERKRVHGREMWRIDLEELKDANRSDLSQTYRLWQLWRRGKLIVPQRYAPKRNSEELACGPHSQLRPGAYIDLETEEMTEGQMAEYMAGTWGITAGGEFVEM